MLFQVRDRVSVSVRVRIRVKVRVAWVRVSIRTPLFTIAPLKLHNFSYNYNLIHIKFQ